MTEDQAIELLQLHALVHHDVNHPKMENGFLGMVKYYAGELNEDNFHEVMEAIRCLAGRIQADVIERDIVANLHGICFCVWTWVVKPANMSQRKGIVSQRDSDKLYVWIDCIYWTTTLLLDGEEFDVAFSKYHEYLGKPVGSVDLSRTEIQNGLLACL